MIGMLSDERFLKTKRASEPTSDGTEAFAFVFCRQCDAKAVRHVVSDMLSCNLAGRTKLMKEAFSGEAASDCIAGRAYEWALNRLMNSNEVSNVFI